LDSIQYRGDWIRTSGPCLPKAVLYQAELHPVVLMGYDAESVESVLDAMSGFNNTHRRGGTGDGAGAGVGK
jgi:hypothetical protein